MAKRNEIRAVSGIMVNGKFTELSELTEKERSEWQARQMERLAKAHEDYFRAHPDELKDYIKQPGVTFTPR